MKGDEAVTQRPFVHRLVEDDVLWEDDHSDVLKPAQPLQDLGHWLGLGLFHHAADPHHDLSLRGLERGEGGGKRLFNDLSAGRSNTNNGSFVAHTREQKIKMAKLCPSWEWGLVLGMQHSITHLELNYSTS